MSGLIGLQTDNDEAQRMLPEQPEPPRYSTFEQKIDMSAAGGDDTDVKSDVVPLKAMKDLTFEDVMPNKTFDQIVNGCGWYSADLKNNKVPKDMTKKLRFKHVVHQGTDSTPEKMRDQHHERKIEEEHTMTAEALKYDFYPKTNLPQRKQIRLEKQVSRFKDTLHFMEREVKKVKRQELGAEADTEEITRNVSQLRPEYEQWLQEKKGRVFQVPNQRRILFVDAKIKRLSDINTAEETFKAMFHFYLTYLATEDEADDFTLKKILGKRSEFKPKWNPVSKLQFTNRVDGNGPKQDGSFDMKPGYEFVVPNQDMIINEGGRTCRKNEEMMGWKKGKAKPISWEITPERLGFDPRYGYWLRVKYECEMTFAEEFELSAFPFDSQDLTIEMGCNMDTTQMDILPMPRIGDFVMLDPRFSLISEWYLAGILVETGMSPVKSKSGKKRYRMSLHIKASRRWMTSLSYWIVTFCMFFLSLAMFAIEPIDDVGDRLGFGITFLLADVATLQLLNEKTPAIPYWTILDYYMYACFVFLSGIICWSALVGGVSDIGGRDADLIAMWVAIGIFLVFHFTLAAVILYISYMENQKLKMTEVDLDEHFGDQLCCNACKTVLNNPTYEVKWDFGEMLELELGPKHARSKMLVQNGEKLVFDKEKKKAALKKQKKEREVRMNKAKVRASTMKPKK